MVYRRFSVLLALRLVIVGLSLAAFVWLLLRPGHHSAMLIAVGLLVMTTAELWWYVDLQFARG